MEKTIETIWKEGFLNSDALVAPQLNDLYNQKSKHIIDKITRMHNINIIALFVFALAVLIGYFFIGHPYTGVCTSSLFAALAIFSKKHWNEMAEIDKSLNTYQYLKAFDSWWKDKLAINTRICR